MWPMTEMSHGCMNRLFYGDNLEVMRRHLRDETVDLCYIDPPFNSKRTYNQIYNNVGSDDLAQAQAFIDTWRWDDEARSGFPEIVSNDSGRYSSHTIELISGLRNVLKEGPLLAYLVSMTRRIVEIQRILKPSGAFYLHCDPTSSHYLKLICDGIFCGKGGEFLNEIIWKRTSAHSGAKRYGPVHDTLLFYSKSSNYVWNEQYGPYDDEYVDSFFTHVDDRGRRWRRTDLTGPGVRHGDSGLPWRDYDPTAKGRHWQPPSYFYDKYRSLTGDDLAAYDLISRLEKLDETGLVHWPQKKGGMPQGRRLLEDAKGIPLQDVWTDLKPLHNMAPERLGYPTQKPEALMERIIAASTNRGGVVFDPFCGCGTTIAVAQRLRRDWIGIDITYQSIALVLRRIEDQFGSEVAASVVMDGAPRDMQSAHALANKKDDRLRKEFEKWAILTYSRNRAAINQKKGADSGIDGYAYIFTNKRDTDRIVFQVKSGNVGRGDVAKLKGDMEREHAVIGTLISLEDPTQPMRTEAKKAGVYTHPFTGATYDRVQIVTVQEILEQRRRLDMPLNAEVLKAAVAAEHEKAQGAFALESETAKKPKMAKAHLPLAFGEPQQVPPKKRRRA